jgi:type IV pilus assembly protein PilB
MFEAHTQAILELCREHHLLDEKTLAELQEEHRATGVSVASIIVENKLVDKADFFAKIAQFLGLEYADELPASISGDISALVTSQHARNYGVVPLRADAHSIDLLALDPFNAQLIDDLTFALRKDVRLVVADPNVSRPC